LKPPKPGYTAQRTPNTNGADNLSSNSYTRGPSPLSKPEVAKHDHGKPDDRRETFIDPVDLAEDGMEAGVQ
jgi:hypothetical protein